LTIRFKTHILQINTYLANVLRTWAC